MFLYRIVLPLEDLVKRAPFSSQLVTVQPIVRKLVSESFKCLLSACAELDHWTPCLRLPFEVLDECDEGDRCRGGGVGGCQQLPASSTCPYAYTAEKGTHLHVVDTLDEDKFSKTRRVVGMGNAGLSELADVRAPSERFTLAKVEESNLL